MYSNSSNLHRVAGPVDRLDAVDHRPPHAADKIAVEKGDRRIQPPGQLGLPVVPGVEIQVVPRHPPAARVEDVQVFAAGPAAAKNRVQLDVGVRIGRGRGSQPNIRRA